MTSWIFLLGTLFGCLMMAFWDSVFDRRPHWPTLIVAMATLACGIAAQEAMR